MLLYYTLNLKNKILFKLRYITG